MNLVIINLPQQRKNKLFCTLFQLNIISVFASKVFARMHCWILAQIRLIAHHHQARYKTVLQLGIEPITAKFEVQFLGEELSKFSKGALITCTF